MIKKDSPSLMSSFFYILQASMESKTCFERPAPKSVECRPDFRLAPSCVIKLLSTGNRTQ
jgi:hypothetical protein